MKMTFSFDDSDDERQEDRDKIKMHMQAEDLQLFVEWTLTHELLRPIYKNGEWPEFWSSRIMEDKRFLIDHMKKKDKIKILTDYNETCQYPSLEECEVCLGQEKDNGFHNSSLSHKINLKTIAKEEIDKLALNHIKPCHLDGVDMADILMAYIAQALVELNIVLNLTR